jgi:glycolate oxidase iron-sulfur subunit
MRAQLDAKLELEPFAREAAGIVRNCVHCGFCNATCPTYQLTGNELDGPRGRIYLIKNWLESGAASATTLSHLERCLLCRSCETTCPSGVDFGRLAELARPRLDATVGASVTTRVKRALLRASVPYPRRYRMVIDSVRLIAGVLPAAWRTVLRLGVSATRSPAVIQGQRGRVLLLGGCAQAVFNPGIDAAAQRVLGQLGYAVSISPGADCCGALAYHLGDEQAASQHARATVDAWSRDLTPDTVGILATSSGCSLHLREYARLLADDERYTARAARILDLHRDALDLIDSAYLRPLLRAELPRIAVQTPCTLQHGLRYAGRVEDLLRNLGFTLTPAAESHLCCGSAGAYSILQPTLSRALRARKLEHLMAGAPAVIATANIGCQLHLAGTAVVPVKHWLEIVAEALSIDA